MTEPRILTWDIESTGLNATFGSLLCIGYKWYGHPRVYIPTILDHQKPGESTDMLDDHGLVKAFAAVFNSADYHVTWYGNKFDLPFIRTKLLKYGEPPLRPIPSVDLWWTAAKKFKLHNNRLASWQEYLETDHNKTPIHFGDWRRAAFGNRAALERVKLHCKMDVLSLEEVFTKFRPWLRNEPTRSWYTGDHGLACQSCGSHNLRRQGFKLTKVGRFQQWQCQDCGKWMRSRVSEQKLVRPALVGEGA